MANLTEVKEGLAKITFEGDAKAFYNPAQEINRDLTVSVLRRLGKERAELATVNRDGDAENVDGPAVKKRKCEPSTGFKILDALSASGLRALRFAKEVPSVTEIIANDFSQDAVEIIKRNIAENGVSHLVIASFGDATQVMSEHRTLNKRFHAVDLDPYGSAAPFLNTAVQCVADRGILMVTCTDMATLCGNTPESALAKYGSTSFRHKSCHESAIRIVLRTVQQQAATYDRYIEPLVCVSIDFYVRCFIRMHTGAAKAKDGAARLSNILYCCGCHALGFQPLVNKVVSGNAVKFNIPRYSSKGLADADGLCVHCRGSVQMAGPLYTGSYFNREFVTELLKDIVETPAENRLGTHKRLVGILTMILEELDDVPLFYEMAQQVQVCKVASPKFEVIRSAFLNAGYRISGSHCNPNALKTDAPVEFMWDVVRALAIKNNNDINRVNDKSPGRKILEAPQKNDINFTIHPQATINSIKLGLLRFQDNKGRNHGPKAKAKNSINSAKAAGYDANMGTDI